MTSTMSYDRLHPDQTGSSYHATHDAEKNCAVDPGTEPRSTRIRLHTRIAHSTLSIPHAPATSCRMSTGRHRRL